VDDELAYVKSTHQFLPGLHGKFRTHAAKDFFAAFRIHGYQIAHQFVAHSPFCILAAADTNRKKRRDDPNGDICRRHDRNKEAKGVSDNPTPAGQPVAAVPFRGRRVLRKQTNQETIGNQRQTCGGDRIA
jgi:hypothetical protein